MSQGMYRSGPVVPADIVTYRHNHKLVYVKPQETYDKALDVAQKEFNEELGATPRERIGFSVTSSFNGERQPVRISESAWSSAVARLLRGEVIDVYVRGEADSKERVPPPQYLEVPGKSGSRQSQSNPSSRAASPASSDAKTRRSWFSAAIVTK
ncbi:hypothetical protein FA15DRAFT_670009 [Coprinopsis marcescibilis]|uniref:Uncharacterized protein n=1 Tax=Coprinopsis marcescibilis TaxID=230819 RepID=A0A5C3KVN1_COPMA|nr:hypothetical protein FA15DRAFT_670009 [Coprinopsis marcescibilis]